MSNIDIPTILTLELPLISIAVEYRVTVILIPLLMLIVMVSATSA